MALNQAGLLTATRDVSIPALRQAVTDVLNVLQDYGNGHRRRQTTGAMLRSTARYFV